jgi:hypothetical protein
LLPRPFISRHWATGSIVIFLLKEKDTIPLRQGDDMTVQTFRDLLTRRPFKPFRLVMSSGEAYEVRHPEMALLTRSDMLVGVDVEDGVPSQFKICSLLHVATIEPIDNEASM